MARRINQSRFRTLLRSRTLTVGLLVTAGAMSLALGREIAQRVSVQQELDRLTKDIAQAEQATKDLEQFLTTLKSPSYQEGQARTELNLQKPGEKVLVIPPTNANLNGSDVNGSGLAGSQSSGRTSNYQRWWEYFFGQPAS